MRISVAHRTAYQYGHPVHLEQHVFRLRPREGATQRLENFELNITPKPAGSAWRLDAEGNSVMQAWFSGPMREMSVETAFTVETLCTNPYDYLLPPAEALKLPLRWSEPSLAPYLEDAGDVRGFAASVAEKAQGQLMPFLDELTRMLFTEWRYALRPEGAALPAEETLRAREGSCRDLAVLFCATARSAGVPARFVSGYESASAHGDEAYMHAWAEVYVPGGGWRGYDPSRGLAVSTAHVPVAAAADARQAAPVSGTFRGAGKAEMSVELKVRAEG